MKQILAVCVLALLGFLPGEDPKQFTDWDTPVNLGPVVNSGKVDSCVTISKDGLTLIFSSNRGNASSSNRDLYVSKRECKTAPWGPPAALTMLNTDVWDSCPALSLDEHRLYFTRTIGCGQEDIWVSRRQDRRDDFGWEQPVNLDCSGEGYVNTPARELMPTFFENEQGKVVMYFVSNRPGSEGNDIYQSEMRDDDTFGPATKVEELSSSFSDTSPTVRRDGLEVIFLSNRKGGSGTSSMDFWRATRTSTADPWSNVEFVPSLGNPAWGNGRISLSFDGCELYFSAWNGAANYDLYAAKRERVRGKK